MSNALKSAMKAQRIDLVKKLVDNGGNVDEMRSYYIVKYERIQKSWKC